MNELEKYFKLLVSPRGSKTYMTIQLTSQKMVNIAFSADFAIFDLTSEGDPGVFSLLDSDWNLD